MNVFTVYVSNQFSSNLSVLCLFLFLKIQYKEVYFGFVFHIDFRRLGVISDTNFLASGVLWTLKIDKIM